jgi:NTE family protein
VTPFASKETKDILWSLDFNEFLDDSWGIIRDTDRLIEQFGWYKGDYFRDWIGKLIKEKTGNSESTFADIEAMKEKRGFKSLYFMGTNLSTSFLEVFSAEHTPRTCIADAVRISMSMPLFFAAKRKEKGSGLDLSVLTCCWERRWLIGITDSSVIQAYPR